MAFVYFITRNKFMRLWHKLHHKGQRPTKNSVQSMKQQQSRRPSLKQRRPNVDDGTSDEVGKLLL